MTKRQMHSPFTWLKFVCTVFFCIAFEPGFLWAQEGLPLFGELEMGTYEVGFKSLSVTDGSRPALKGMGGTSGRQIQVNLWYPASGGGGEFVL